MASNWVCKGKKTTTWLYDCLPKWPISEPMGQIFSLLYDVTSCQYKTRNFHFLLRNFMCVVMCGYANTQR